VGVSKKCTARRFGFGPFKPEDELATPRILSVSIAHMVEFTDIDRRESDRKRKRA
jgi:hypothetical protein